METRTDVLVVGLGVTGAALCHELARRGADVVGVDRHEPPHGFGASHGQSRIIREAYFEHSLYVPLVQRAYELWAELEELTGAVVYRRTGGLMLGPPGSRLVTGSLASARDHGLPHETLDATAIRARFPGLHPETDWVGVLEPRAGMLMPELCVRALLGLARGHGAELHTATSVEEWHVTDDGDVVVVTSGGAFRTRYLVLAAGPWMNRLLAMGSAMQLPLAVERQVSHWFAPEPGLHAFRPDSCPVAIWEYDDARLFYTFPDVGHGVKAGIHHEGIPVDPETVDRVVGMGEEQRMRRLLDAYMPGAAQNALHAEVCLYTNTPDGDFIIDRHPERDQVMVVSACSGHGFKFAPAVAEAVADVMLEGGSAFDLEPFRVSRLL